MKKNNDKDINHPLSLTLQQFQRHFGTHGIISQTLKLKNSILPVTFVSMSVKFH